MLASKSLAKMEKKRKEKVSDMQLQVRSIRFRLGWEQTATDWYMDILTYLKLSLAHKRMSLTHSTIAPRLNQRGSY